MTTRSFFAGLWRGLDGLRRVLHLILLLLVFGLAFALLRGNAAARAREGRAGGGARGRAGRAALGRRRSRAPSQEVRGERARRDAAVGPHAMPSTPRRATRASRCWRSIWRSSIAPGSRRSRSSRRAIREFRASGKKVIAYGIELTQERYYLAAQADEIYVDPMGFVLIEGYDRYRTYPQGRARQARRRHQRVPGRRLQERGGDLHAHQHVTRGPRGEPRLPERAVDRYQDAITRARKLAPDALTKYVDSLAQDGARRQGRRRARWP